ncbi:DUF6461 domain-containing protein [Streptomyces sp. NPDC049916]|uniref:DUF6461 domain-containing protein n=1 Tax=Streptomyces sp. NPDC049916 TaxID=3155156 RepID=UPI0034405BC6
MGSASSDYSSLWVGSTGLDLDPGYCITMVRGVHPRSALLRIGIDETAVRTAPWSELRAYVSALDFADQYVPSAAFVVGEYTLLIEENGYRGYQPEWNLPLSRDTDVVSVHLNPASDRQVLSVVRDGEQLAFIDGDEPEIIHADDAELAGRLIHLCYDALKPWEEDEPDPEEFDDGWVDLLQVACDYLELRPTVADVSGPAPGAAVKL